REDSEPLRALRLDLFFALARILGDSAGDRFIEAEVQQLKLSRFDGCVVLGRELGDGLAEISVVVNHLGDREARLRALPTVRSSGRCDFAVLGPLVGGSSPQHRVGELSEEEGNSVRELEAT